jgi:CheY-like chemotaxis protein
MRILVVEDDPVVAMNLEATLAGLDGVETWIAPSVQEARMSLRWIDLAILDIKVKDGDVFPIANQLRLAGKPYVFVSGLEEDTVPAEHKHIPFIAKPFTRAQILDTTRMAIAKLQAPRLQ